MTTRQRWTLVATVIGSGAVFLDGTIVNVALPQIGHELPATVVDVLEGQTYIVSGYLAILAALLILAGALSDHYGRRRVYAIGLAGFAVTSALCGLAPTLELLVVFRLLQGAAGALLVPGSLSLITQAFDGAERGRAFGIWAASTSALTVLGPIVGGVIVDTISWRVAFLINVPLLAIALWATLDPRPGVARRGRTGRFDWLGAIVAALAVGGLAFGLIRGQANEWADTAAWISIAIGVVALVLFPILMARRPEPARAARALPRADVRDDQPRDVLHLRRAVRHVQLPGARAPGRARLHGPRRRLGRHPGRGHAVRPVDPDRDARRRDSVRGGSWSPGRLLMAGGHAVVRAAAGRLRALEGRVRDPATLVPPVSTLIDVLPVDPALRPRHLDGRGAADERADGLDPGALLRPRLGDQQLDLAGRPAAPRRRSSSSPSARPTTRASRPRRPGSTRPRADVRAAFQPLNPAPASATADQVTRRDPGIDRCLPPGDARDAPGCWCIGALVLVVRAARRRDQGANGVTDPDSVPRLGRPHLRPGRRPADALGSRRPRPAAARRRRAGPRRRLRQRPGHGAARRSGCRAGAVVALDALGVDDRRGARAAGAVRRPDRVRRRRPRPARCRSPNRSTRSCRPRPSTGSRTTTRCSGTWPPCPAPGRLARRAVRRRRQHRLGPRGPRDDRRRLAGAGPLRDAGGHGPSGSMPPASSTSNAG